MTRETVDAALPRTPRWRRVASVMRRLQPLTPLGLLTTLLAGWALMRSALPSTDLVLTTAATLALISVGLCITLVVGATLLLWRHRRLALEPGAHRLEAGARYSWPSPLRWVGFLPLLRVDVKWIVPPAAAVQLGRTRRGGPFAEAVTFGARAHVPTLLREVRVGDVLGLCRIGLRARQPSELLVLPERGELAQRWPVHSLISGDAVPDPRGEARGDRAELKRYAPGDPARFIHWKIYGRTGVAVVRHPEAAVSQAQRLAVGFLSGVCDEASAGAARVFLERLAQEAAGGQLSWHFAASGASAATQVLEDAQQQLAESAGKRGTFALRQLLKRLAREGPAACVLFVPAEAGAWIEDLRPALRDFRGSLHLVMAADALPRRRVDGVKRLFTLREPPRQTTPTARGWLRVWREAQGLRPAATHFLLRPTGQWVDGHALATRLRARLGLTGRPATAPMPEKVRAA